MMHDSRVFAFHDVFTLELERGKAPGGLDRSICTRNSANWRVREDFVMVIYI